MLRLSMSYRVTKIDNDASYMADTVALHIRHKVKLCLGVISLDLCGDVSSSHGRRSFELFTVCFLIMRSFLSSISYKYSNE